MAGSENKVKFGLKNVHYAPITAAEEGTVTFATPVRIPGAVSLSMQAQGDESKFYADDVAYYVSTANDGYSGDLEIAIIPDTFRKDVLKESEDETDKVLVENATAEPAAFALLLLLQPAYGGKLYHQQCQNTEHRDTDDHGIADGGWQGQGQDDRGHAG